MTAAWVVLGATVLALIVLGVVVALALRSGGAEERRDQARRDADASDEQARRMAGALPTQADRARAARRKLRERGARMPDDDAA